MANKSPVELAQSIIASQNRDYVEAMTLLNEAMKIMVDSGMCNVNFSAKVEQFLIRSGQRTLELKQLFGDLDENNRT